LVSLYNKHLINYTVLLLYGGLWPDESGRKIKSSGRKASVSFDVENRRVDGHSVDVDLVGSTKSFYAFLN
jgi:hypothetical protein